MTRFRVAWNGTVEKTIAVYTPADALHHVWSRYRDQFVGGTIDIRLDEGGGGALQARVSFPVRIAREIEAENPSAAVGSFLDDDLVPGLVDVHDIEVEPITDPPIPDEEPTRG